jgi:hypothetical protein
LRQRAAQYYGNKLSPEGGKVKGGKPFMIDDFSRKKAQKKQKLSH